MAGAQRSYSGFGVRAGPLSRSPTQLGERGEAGGRRLYSGCRVGGCGVQMLHSGFSVRKRGHPPAQQLDLVREERPGVKETVFRVHGRDFLLNFTCGEQRDYMQGARS